MLQWFVIPMVWCPNVLVVEQISGQRLVAMVDSWDVGHVFPSGHYVASLGPVGEVRWMVARASKRVPLLGDMSIQHDPTILAE